MFAGENKFIKYHFAMLGRILQISGTVDLSIWPIVIDNLETVRSKLSGVGAVTEAY